MLLDYIPDKGLGATSGTVYVYASGSVAPGQVQVSKSGTYANSVNVSVGGFSSYTGMAGYDWRASIAVTSDSSQGWPLSADSTVVLTVSTSPGIIVGSVDVLLSSTSAWSFQPSWHTVSSSSGWVSFYLYCVVSFDASGISIDYNENLQFRTYDVVPSTDLSGFSYRLNCAVRLYNSVIGTTHNYFYYNGILIGDMVIRIAY
jgi:hypothetical protein